MFRFCKRNGKNRKTKLGILSSLAIATIIAQAGGAFAVINLTNPEYRTKEEGYSLYNYVYYGKTGADANTYAKTNDPILFRVLNTKANDTENTDALLLLSEYDIYKDYQLWDGSVDARQTWATDSTIRTMLNNSTSAGGTLYDCFSAEERAPIMATTNGETKEGDKINWYDNSYYAYGCGLTGDKLFLLSAKEAVNKDYGFANIADKANVDPHYGGLADSNRLAKRGDAAGSSINWWLRSAYSHYQANVAFVSSVGDAYYSNTNIGAVGVRFALNIPMSSIIYTSDANAESIVSSQLAQIAPKAKTAAICAQSPAPTEATIVANASKLTILDASKKSFKVTEDGVSVSAGQDVTLHYTGAKTGSNEFISIIIKDSAGEGLYYGTPTAAEASGLVTFTVPEDLADGNYTVDVLNEQKNDAKLTNYAGVATVGLSVGKKAVVTATEQGEAGLWKVVSTPDPDAPALATFTGTKEQKTQTVTFYVPETVTQVYVVDYAENVSDPIALNKDTAAPTKEVTYNEGKITLTITDAGAGIKRVDEKEEQPTEAAKGYPTEVTVENVAKSKETVTVVDALGNDATLDLNIDNTKPLITKAYKRIDEASNVKKAIIKATDEGGAGLWKAVSSNAENGETVCSFDNKPNAQEKVFDLTNSAIAQVYAVDHAGNISDAAVTLEEDSTPPTGEVTYNNGTITLAVSDTQSGIAKIGETPYTDYPASKDYPVTTGTETVEMVDALGNKATTDIDHTAPEVSEKFIRVTDGQGYVTITATDTDSGLWKVVATNSKTATPLGENVSGTYKGEFTGEGPTQTVRFKADSALREVYVVDKAGNVTDKVTLTLDSTPPQVTEAFIRVANGKGNVTITATDVGVGLWKVVASKDAEAAALKTFDGVEPTETVRFEAAQTLREVYVVDKAGNVTEKVTLTLDSAAPTVSEAFISGSNVTITATDEGVGLWKVVASKNADAEALGTFEGEGATKTARFAVTDSTLREVYVVDKAGNITDVVRLTEDITPPQATRAFIKVVGEQGKVILTATDDVSGMWKVVDVDDTVLYTYTADDTDKVRFDVTDNTLREVYLVDKAGNKSTAVELVEDSEKPVLTSGYIR